MVGAIVLFGGDFRLSAVGSSPPSPYFFVAVCGAIPPGDQSSVFLSSLPLRCGGLNSIVSPGFFILVRDQEWPRVPASLAWYCGHERQLCCLVVGVWWCCWWVVGVGRDDGNPNLAIQGWSSSRSCATTMTRIVWGMDFSPELVPVMYCFCVPTGVGFSLCFLGVIWATGVRSGWFCIVLFISTGVRSGLLLVSIGLLYGFSIWCHVSIIVECLGRSLDMGLSLPIPKGVTLFGPSGVIRKLLNVLVSSPLIGGSFVHGGTLVLLG